MAAGGACIYAKRIDNIEILEAPKLKPKTNIIIAHFININRMEISNAD